MGTPKRVPVGAERGVTLTELVVVLGIFGAIMAGILAVWTNAQRAYFVGSEAVEIQGDARVAIDQMIRDIRKAGRDVLQCAFDSEAYTDCSGAKLARCQSLLTNPGFSCNNIFIIPQASATTLQIQMDLNADGLIDTSAPSEESVTYAFDLGNRRITRAQGIGTARPLADNIESLNLTYEGRAPNNGVCTGAFGAITGTSQTDRDCIQRITIDMVARATVAGEVVSRTLNASVDLRAR